MILYNVTCHVDDFVLEEWLIWMKNVHIPEVMQTNKFVEYRMYKIDPIEESDAGSSFSIQYFAKTRQDYLDYVEQYAPLLKQKTLEKYGQRVLAFRTILESL